MFLSEYLLLELETEQFRELLDGLKFLR